MKSGARKGRQVTGGSIVKAFEIAALLLASLVPVTGAFAGDALKLIHPGDFQSFVGNFAA